MPLALPKPEKSGPNPRKRIPRKSARVPLRSGGRKAKPAKKRRVTRLKLRALCDELFSVTIRLRGRGRCKLCGHGAGLAVQCAHLVSRRYLALRWEESNAWALCAADHVRYTHDPSEWHMRLVAEFAAEEDQEGKLPIEEHLALGLARLDALHRTACRGLDAPPLYAEIAPHLVERLEAVHAAVPYDALTEALHERAREALAKAERMIG